MNLALKYRPARFDQVVGQPVAVKVLKQLAISRDDLRVVLLAGQYGVGKTTLARLYGKLSNCENKAKGDACGECRSCQAMKGMSPRHPDYSERDMGSHGLVADMRRLQDEALIKPTWHRRIFTLDEVHGASREAFNSLLKILEEPPRHVAVVMCTTELNQVPYVIASRSLLLKLSPLSVDHLTERLMAVAEEEKVKVSPKAAELIARYSGGSMRDGFMTLERMLVLGDGSVDVETLAEEPWYISEKFVSKMLIVALKKKDRQEYLKVVKGLTGRISYETLLRDSLKKLCRLHIDKGWKSDEAIESLWRAYLRVKRGSDPDLVMEGLWVEATG